MPQTEHSAAFYCMNAGELMAAAAREGVEGSDLNYLLAELLNCNSVELPLQRQRELGAEQVSLFWGWHTRLLNHEPPQYILGKCWFHGLELEVNPAVLIPRPETEGLVELAGEYITPSMRILEIGTGSGAIGIALQKLHPGIRVAATDICPEVLAVASRNAARHRCAIDFYQSDLFPEEITQFDLIISNPPYISSPEYAGLEPRVREYEPSLALQAEEDGLAYYCRILALAEPYLSSEGLILFEHGASQRARICEMALELGYTVLLAAQDIAGRDRYLGFCKSIKDN